MEYFLFLTMYLRSVKDGSLTAIVVLTVALIVVVALAALGFYFRKYVSFVFKSVRRNLLRSLSLDSFAAALER